MITEFMGNQICCGTYAFLNLTRDSSIDIDLFEISTSVPFGIAHKRYPKFDHLLTPFCDPNMGLDTAISAWGYRVEHDSFTQSDAVVRFFQQKLAIEESVMIGPVDMGHLYYQPLINLYRRLDHYIVVTKIDESFVEILDSEGIICEKCSIEMLGKILSVRDVPEAGGAFHIRKALKERDGNVSSIVMLSLVLAEKNIARCLASNDGNNAFLNCFHFLQEVPLFQWRFALLYDFSYIMQRKLLHKKLGEYAVFYNYWRRAKMIELQCILEEQIRTLGKMFSMLKSERIPSECYYEELDRLETMLPNILSED